MKKSISVNTKSRGRPKKVGGVHPVAAVRLPPELSKSVDTWAARQVDKPGRSEAIRRLVGIGLAAQVSTRQSSSKQKLRAQEMAGKAIDKMSDNAAPADEKAERKRKLLKGPAEFRDARVDRKTKPK
jgi:hypothetical protein